MRINQNISNQMICNLLQTNSMIMPKRITCMEFAKEIRGDQCLEHDGHLYSLFELIEMVGQYSEILIRESYMMKEKRLVLAMVLNMELNLHVLTSEKCKINCRLENVVNGFYKTNVSVVCNSQTVLNGSIVHSEK